MLANGRLARSAKGVGPPEPEIPSSSPGQVNIALCGLIEKTGLTFTRRKSIGQMSAESNAVLANGRLARMAFIRVSFQVLRRRAVESERGRVSQGTGIGYFVQGYSNLIGYLSPPCESSSPVCRTVWSHSLRSRWLGRLAEGWTNHSEHATVTPARSKV